MKNWCVILFLSAFLASCGSGSSGGTDPGMRDNGNMEPEVPSEVLSRARGTTETAKGAIIVDLTVTPIITKQATSSSYLVVGALKQHADEMFLDAFSAMPTEVEDVNLTGTCGGNTTGTITTTTPENEAERFPLSVVFDVDYNEFCIDSGNGQVTADGNLYISIVFLAEDAWESEISYDVDYSADNSPFPAANVQASQSCVKLSGMPEQCDVDNSFVVGGANYTLSSGGIDGNENDGYSFEATLTEDNGDDIVSYEVVFSDLVVCDNGNFESGSFTVSEVGGDTLSVEFLDCDTARVSYQGITEDVDQ